MNVVSLFNGMNTGRQALENVGIKVDKYYSSEIKPYAIELTQYHFPDTIQVGDVTKWKEWDIDWKSIDLVLSGSPCQDLSVAGKRAGIEGEKSSLFFKFVEILEHIKLLNPKVLFFQENVGSASKLDIGIMSRVLGVYPVRINSELLVAASRDRYYWSNIRTRQDGMFGDIITDIPLPKDKEITFQSILTSGETKRNKSTAIMERYYGCFFKDENSENAQKYLLSRDSIGMCPIALEENGKVRTLNKTEMCRLQGFPDNYCDILTKNNAASLLGDGWTLPVIEHIFKFINK
jgi:site-specific DNA-cytosine methylase